MHTDEPREVEGVELGYDPRDIQEKGIYRVVVYFFLFALFFFGVGAIVYVRLGVGQNQHFDARKPEIVGPKVQGNIAAKVDIMRMRQDERAQLESYGRNPDGKRRIPVDRAMRLLAQRGLPEIKDDKKAVSPGNTIEQNAVGPAGAKGDGSASGNVPGGVAGPAPTSTPTTPAETPRVPTPDQGPGAQGGTAGGVAP